MMERRERDLLTQLRAATTASSLDVTGGGAGGSLPVSQILGDLKEKQEQLFLQYMGKLKAGGGRAAMGGVMVGSSMPSQVTGGCTAMGCVMVGSSMHALVLYEYNIEYCIA